MDYRDITPDGQEEKIYDWVFIPYNVYTDPDLKDEKIENFLNFDEVYNGADHFFVNRAQLDELKEKDDLLLPMKTNLILLDQTTIEETSPLLNLFFIITFNNFRNERMILYFEDGEYSINLERIYKLWYYILFKWYGKDIEFTAPSLGIFYTIDNPISLDYTLEDIDLIQERYNNLSLVDDDAGEKIRIFYKEVIEDVFKQFQRTPIEYTQDEWTKVFKDALGKDLIEYVDGRMTDIEVGSDISIEANKLLDEIYNSLITWNVTSDDPDITNYFHYFLDMLPFLIVQPEKTGTFRVMNFLKPFHVELTGQGRIIYDVHDKFNSVLPDNKFNYIMQMSKASMNHVSHQLMQKASYAQYDTQSLINDFHYIINQYLEMIVPIIDEFEPKIIDSRQSLADQQHQDIKELTLPMWEYDLEGIVTVGQFISIIPIEDPTPEVLYDFPVVVSIPENSSIDIREDSVDTTITPYVYNFNIGDRGDPKVLQYLETINDIKYYLIFNLMFIKHTMQHSSHEFPQKIKQLKQFDALYSFIQGDTISKLFKSEPSIVRKFKRYFKSNTWKSTFMKMDSADFLPTTMIPPKFDNLLAHIEDDLTLINSAHDLLIQEFMYNINPELPISSIQELSDRYFYNIKSKGNRDWLEIDGHINTVSKRDTDEELIDILNIYKFDTEKTKYSIAQIQDKYSTRFDPGPLYSNMHMLSWVRQTGMQEYLTLEAIEVYRFDAEISKATISNISDRMIANTIMPPKFDNMHIFIDDCTVKHQVLDNVATEYSYEFNQDISKGLLLDVLHTYQYSIKLVPTFDNLHWFIYNHTGMRTEEFVDIDYSYKFSDDWSFLTDVDIEHIVSIPQDQPDMFDYLNIGVENRTGLWGDVFVNLNYSYVFDQVLLTAYVEEVLDEFSFNIQLDSEYDNFQILSSFEGFSATVSSNFNNDDYFENLITSRKGIIQHFQHICPFVQEIIRTEDFNILSKFKNIIGVTKDSRNFYNYDWNFINSIVNSSNQFIRDESCFSITDKSRYDTVHHYMSIPKQYGFSEFDAPESEKYFMTVMPFNHTYDYWEEAFQIIHQRAYHDGLPIQDNHILKHAYFERQIIEEFYRFIPMKYTEKTSAELAMSFSVPMWFRYKTDNLHIESNFYQIQIQYEESRIEFIHKVPLKFSLIRGTNIELSYLQWYNIEINAVDNCHIFGRLHGFSFDVMDKSVVPSHDNNVVIDYQRGSTVDFWYFSPFDLNAIYSSIGLDLKHHRSFTQGGVIDLEIDHYIPFDYTHVGNTNSRFLHHLDWRELHPHPFEIDTELVFTMQPQYVIFDIEYQWNFPLIPFDVHVDTDHIFNIRMPDLLATWFYMISHIESLNVKQHGKSIQQLKNINNERQILPEMWVIEVKDNFPIEFTKRDTEHLNIVSFGEPIPIQYGPAPVDITYGFNFIDKFRTHMILYEIESEYNFITKLFPQESSMVVETIGVPKNRHFEELFIEDYFLPINSEYFKSSIFNINDKIEFIVEPYRGYDNLNIISIGTAKNQYWDYPNILDTFNFVGKVFKSALLDIQYDKTFSIFEKSKRTSLAILDDNIFIFDYYLSDLFNDITFNFDFSFIREQNININIDTNKQDKNVEMKGNFDKFGIGVELNSFPIQKQLEAIYMLYNIKFGDYLLETKVENSIGENIEIIISPYMIMDSQNYIVNSDLNINKFKEEVVNIGYDYGQIGYAPEVVENSQVYEEGINMIISGNKENIEQMNILHNFNTIKI